MPFYIILSPPKLCHVNAQMFVEKVVSNTGNDKLSELTVQSKFTAIIELESQNNVWKRIQKGMPAVQLSFLLRAGSDTLPTPLNL